MNTKIIAAVAAVAVLVIAGCAMIVMSNNTNTDDDSPTSYDRIITENSINDWNYWLGNTDLAGVSDAKTPISSEDIEEKWKVSGTMDSGSSNWKTPGSAISIGSYTYYYNGSDTTLRCVETSTGKQVDSQYCFSNTVYNMAIAYGDGKIFVPCSIDGNTVLKAFNAETLDQLFVSEGVSSSEVQGSITYHDGFVYFGTYGNDFACFSTEDTNTSRSDEVISAAWIIESDGWYNSTPAFAGDYCIVASGGYKDGGTTIYVLDHRTGAIYDTVKIESEYCSSGATFYDGRVYVALNKVINSADQTSETNTGKTMTIHSFEVTDDGKLVSEKIWASSVKDGGTQSTPVIYNDRLYICGGGSTMGSAEPFTVIDISSSGNMTTAYTVKTSDGEGLCSKSTPSITIGYASESNGYTVYIYIIEYGHVKGSDLFSPVGSADIYVLKDHKGQTSQEIAFHMTPSVEQFAYQSFTITSDGYLLIRNDSTLFCYGHKDVTDSLYDAIDVSNAIDRLIDLSSVDSVNSAEVSMVEERYLDLSSDDKAKVTNYSELQELYCNVTLKIDEEEVIMKVLKGSMIDLPSLSVPSDKVLSGLYATSGEQWVPWNDRVIDDITLTVRYADTVKMKFDANGGDSDKTLRVVSGDVIGYVADPIREGYTFDGWYSGSTEYIPSKSTAPVSSIELKAKWLKNYTITFDSTGGLDVKSMTVIQSKEVGDLPTVSRNGYVFDGWYLDDTRITSTSIYTYTEDIVLTAKWTENTGVTINNGKGISVTAPMPSDSKIYVSKAYAGGSGVKAVNELAGKTLDVIKVTVSGEGVTGNTEFEVSMTLGASYNEKSLTAYYYTPSLGARSVSGIVYDGIFTIAVTGDGTSYADMIIGMESDKGIYNCI